MVYNGLNPLFTPGETLTARETLGNKTGLSLLQGYLLHVGGNQWYKNRIGVIDIYDAWRHKNNTTGGLPLLLIGQPPSPDLIKRFEASPFREDIHFLKKIEDELLRSAYAGATLFLFPSLAEGFGWPIAEAMASGCPVVTTNETPMTEVAGEAGFLIRPRPAGEIPVAVWAGEAADVINHILTLSPEDKKKISDAGFENAARFEIKKSIDAIENIYKRIIHSQ
jgi:glycosyltransferase involved in cell wall biosynthesis